MKVKIIVQTGTVPWKFWVIEFHCYIARKTTNVVIIINQGKKDNNNKRTAAANDRLSHIGVAILQ